MTTRRASSWTRSRSARGCWSASRARSTPSSSATSSRRSRARWRPRSPTRRGSWPSSSAPRSTRSSAPENGHLAKELARLFGEGSSTAVQHQLRQVMLEQSARMREDLLRQFSSADGSNPLADFKAAHLRAARDAATRQETQLERHARADGGAEARAGSRCAPSARRRRKSPPRPRAAPPRAAPTRRPSPRPWTRSPAGWATTARPSATSAAPAGARATWSSTSTAAPAPRAAGSSSRPSTRASRARRRCPSWRRR